MRIPLGLAFNNISANCMEMFFFRLAYSYRNQFDYLGENGSEEDPSGLIAAVSRSLSFSVGFQFDEAYLDSAWGIETIPRIEEFLDKKMNNNHFKSNLYDAAIRLSDQKIHCFFETLGYSVIDLKRSKIDHEQPLTHPSQRITYNLDVLQQAVKKSLFNYARTAALGAHPESYDEEEKPPQISVSRLKFQFRDGETVRSSDLATILAKIKL